MAAASVADHGRLVVSQSGPLPHHVWTVRVERADASTAVEQAFREAPISVDTRLPKGDYRVVSWSRACNGACPTSGEKGLGPLGNVCGKLVRVTGGEATRVRVAVSPDGSCAISTAA